MAPTAVRTLFATALILASHQLFASAQGYGDTSGVRTVNQGGYGAAATRVQSVGASRGGQGAWGDPMFRGLDGRVFYFDGVAGSIFNILSEQDHQLNAGFSVGPHKIDALGQKTQGTFMTSFGLLVFTSRLQATVDEEGNMTVILDGQDVEQFLKNHTDFKHDVTATGVNITVERYRPNVGHVVSVKTMLLEMLIYPTTKQLDIGLNETLRGHLNFELAVNPALLALTDIHGVLGQNTVSRSGDTALITDQLSTLFLGEGEDEDYIVSNLFGTDFKFNRFGVSKRLTGGSVDQPQRNGWPLKRTSQHMSAARRFLKEQSKPTYLPVFKLSGLL